MTRINLLQFTPGPESNKATQIATSVFPQAIMVIVAALALVMIIGTDYFLVRSQNSEIKERLAKEEEKVAELRKMAARRDELRKQKQAIDDRIRVIKQLQEDQVGPVTLLSQINDRIPDSSDFYLYVVRQKDQRLALVGFSLSEERVAKFAKDFEFSNGVFESPEITTVVPVSFTSGEKLLAHITEQFNDFDIRHADLDREATNGEKAERPKTKLDLALEKAVKDRGDDPNKLFFIIKCSYKPKHAATQEQAQAKQPVVSVN